MLVKYIGPTQTFNASTLDPRDTAIANWPKVNVENNKEYNIEIQYDGPQVIINNMPVCHPDGFLWVIFPELNARIPYNQQCIKNHWEIDI